jgi:hypothetical protein
MKYEQRVEIPQSRRLTIDLPREMPAGKALIIVNCMEGEEALPATMGLSESALAEDWNAPEEDKIWADL